MLKKSLILGIVFNFCASLIFAQTAVAPSVGDGSESNPYEIETLNNLYWIAADNSRWSSNYIQTANIDASETQTWFDGKGWLPIATSATFFGAFNGQNYNIDNLYINRADSDEIGLFARVGASGNYTQLKNINLVGINITGNGKVGSLAGYCPRKIYVNNCSTSGTIIGHGDEIGGLIGKWLSVEIKDCSSNISINGQSKTGGLVGSTYGGLIDNCYSVGNVSGTDQVGGLAGKNSATVLNSYSTGNVSGAYNVGGLIGYSIPLPDPIIENCYSTGDISGAYNVGGLAGSIYDTHILNSFSTGNITSNGCVGGFVGTVTQNSSINSCYSTGYVSGTDQVGGFIAIVNADADVTVSNCFWDKETSGQTSTAGNATGKITAQMKIQATFTASGWDFLNIWALNDTINDGYPHLLWFTYIDPCVETLSIEAGSDNCALINCKIVNLGNPDPIQHGVCWSTASSPTIDDNKTELGEKHDTGTFSPEITGLIENTVYYVRAYATNAKNTVYGEVLSFMNNPNITSIFSNITDGPIEGGLSLIDDNAIYAVSSGDGVYRYNKEGSVVYKLNVNGDIKSSTTITQNNNVYIASTDYNLYSFNSNGLSNTGWPVSLGSEATASVAIDNQNNLYIGTSNGVFQCISSSGSVLWGYIVGGAVYSSSAISSKNILYVINENGRVFTFNLNILDTAQVAYEQKIELDEQVVSSPALDDEGFMYITTLNGNLVKLNVDTSNICQEWVFSAGDPIYSSPIIGSDYTTYFGSTNGKVYAINKDGTLQWDTDLGHPIRSTAALAEFGTNNDRLYIGSDGGYLNTLSLIDGSVIDKYKTDADVRCPILYDNNTVYFGTMDGEVIAVPDTIEVILSKKINITSQWPTFQSNNQRTGAQAPTAPAISTVYPGDTNNDGTVDELDILPIGVYFLEEGTSRSNASMVWEAQDVTSWPSYPANYADCNGDGVVDEKDIIPIGVNWGQTRTASIQKHMINPNDKQMLAKHKEAFETIYNSIDGIESAPAEAIRQLLETALEIIPKTITLYQCYPNPFNPNTEIKFSLPEKMNVSLKVFDINGRLIKTLVNGSYLETGYHSLTFHGDAYPSGMYIYILETSQSIQAQKMLLLK